MRVHIDQFILVVSIFLFDISCGQYVPPTPTVEPLAPRGLRISIPHEDGISLVAYHVKFNDDFYSLEAGTIAVDIIKPRNGRWVYQDRTTKLKIGDIIYMWVHVVYNGLGYNLLDQQHEVTEFYNANGTIAGPVQRVDGSCKVASDTKVYTRDGASQQLKRNSACAGQLIFEENFDTLDTNRWKIIERFSEAPNFEFVVYKNDEENVHVRDGKLYIKPTLVKEKYGLTFVQDGSLRLDKCTAEIGSLDCSRVANAWNILPPVISGRLNTKPSFNFMYGKVQVRAKLPSGDWIYPLITLENDASSNESSYCSFMIAHSFGNPLLVTTEGKDIGSKFLQAGAYVTNLENNDLQDNRMALPTKVIDSSWSNDYHIYEIEWKREHVILRVDDIKYGEQRVPSMFDVPVYINVGVGVGGRSLFPDGCRSGNYVKPWKNKGVKALYNFYSSDNTWLANWGQVDKGLSIDYIKVYAL
ncbi:beta-1,3-glucan recognition protein 1 [Megalopta genalis]|uniref:beta-1,3-glucan recognition protein 1 n=1 Tax=Megalopta genalis TaxID=115081 RepID=UPI003FD16DE0